MPSPDPDDAPSGGRESWLGPKGSRKRTAVQVAIGLAGLLIAYLIYRSQRRQNTAAAAAGGAYTYPSLGNGSPVDTGIGDQLAAGFAAQTAAISSLQAQIGGNPTASVGPSTPIPPRPAPRPPGPAGATLGTLGTLTTTPTYTRYAAPRLIPY